MFLTLRIRARRTITGNVQCIPNHTREEFAASRQSNFGRDPIEIRSRSNRTPTPARSWPDSGRQPSTLAPTIRPYLNRDLTEL